MNKIPFSEALAHVCSVKPVYSITRVPLEEAVGKILAEPLYAQYNVPPAACSAMDGFAVRAADTAAASEEKPLSLTEFEKVNTGNVVRDCFDAVIMVEDVKAEDGKITITAPIKPGRNVRAVGEDIFAGSLVLPAGARLRSFDIGAVAGYGITEVAVREVRIGIIPTGTELIKPGQVPKAGEVVESNTIMTAAYLREFGAVPTRYPPVADDLELMRAALKKALAENDVVLISAGSSMGSRDFTSTVIEELGKIIFHGVFSKPAKPSMLGIVDGKPVIGMPGFPLSAQTTLRMFVREMLINFGLAAPEALQLCVRAGEDIMSDEKLDEFRFASVGCVNGVYTALPQVRSSSMQMNGIRANAYIHIPRGTGDVPCGSTLPAVLNVPQYDLKRTFLLGGICRNGAERLTERAAAQGYFVRFGDVMSKAGAELLQTAACHGVVVSTPVAGYDAVSLGDGTFLLTEKESSDPLVLKLKQIAEEK